MAKSLLSAAKFFEVRDKICKSNDEYHCHECPLCKYNCGDLGIHTNGYDYSELINLVEEWDKENEKKMKEAAKQKMLSELNIIDALHSIVWYEGLAKELLQIKSAKPLNTTGCIFSTIPHGEQSIEFQIIWELIVLLFGNYGTSPRVGWIEEDKFQDACDFIDCLVNSSYDD